MVSSGIFVVFDLHFRGVGDHEFLHDSVLSCLPGFLDRGVRGYCHDVLVRSVNVRRGLLYTVSMGPVDYRVYSGSGRRPSGNRLDGYFTVVLGVVFRAVRLQGVVLEFNVSWDVRGFSHRDVSVLPEVSAESFLLVSTSVSEYA